MGFIESFEAACKVCDHRKGQQDESLSDGSSRELFEGFSAAIRFCQEQKSPRPRIAAMLALDRFYMHTSQIEHLDLKASTLAQWTLQSLKSSIRDLRIAAMSVFAEHANDSLAHFM